MKLWLPDFKTKPPFGMATLDWSNPLSMGLVHCVLFNERAGATAYDIGPSRTAGGFNNGVAWVANGVSFDGTDDFVQYTPTADLTLDNALGLSVVVGLRVIDSSSWRFISTYNVSKPYQFYIGGGTKVGGYIVTHDGSVYNETTTGKFTNNIDYTFAMTYDGAHTHVYINGVEQSTAQALTGTLSCDSGTNLWIGSNNGGNYFQGYIYFHYLYSRALSVPELVRLNADPYCFFSRIENLNYKAGGGAAETILADKWYAVPNQPRPQKYEIVSY